MAYFGRGKNRIQNPFGIIDFYKKYRKEIDRGSIYDVDYSTYSHLCKELNKAIFKSIREDALAVRLPYRLGLLTISKSPASTKISSMSVDFKNTVKYKKRIVFLNDHSDGYRFKHKWIKKNAVFKYKSWYAFTPSRNNKRELARIIKTGNYDFLKY